MKYLFLKTPAKNSCIYLRGSGHIIVIYYQLNPPVTFFRLFMHINGSFITSISTAVIRHLCHARCGQRQRNNEGDKTGNRDRYTNYILHVTSHYTVQNTYCRQPERRQFLPIFLRYALGDTEEIYVPK